MTRFQKIQLAFSIIPGVSTLFISIVTMISLKKNQAPKKYWIVFFLAYLLMFFFTSAIVKLFLSEQDVLLQNIVTGLLLAVLNIIFVGIQIAVAEQPHESSSTCVKLTIHSWIVMFIIAIIVICMLIFGTNFDESIADVNGDEISTLAIISDDMLLNELDQYQVFFSALARNGEQTGVCGWLKENDFSEISHSFGKLSGVMTVQATNTNCNQITFNVTSDVESGNLEFIIIVDGKIHARIGANISETIIVPENTGESILIKVGAESAKGNIAVRRILG